MPNPAPRSNPKGPAHAKIAIVVDFPTADDIWKGSPLSGRMGEWFQRLLLDTGIIPSACYITSAMKTRPRQDNPDLYYTSKKTTAHKQGNTQALGEAWVSPEIPSEIQALHEELAAVSPTVILALGDYAMFALTGIYGSVDTWRGSHLDWTHNPSITVIPTYTPAQIMRQWEVKGFCQRDLQRVRDIAREPGYYAYPTYSFLPSPTFTQAKDTLLSLLAIPLSGKRLPLACDIETIARHISCIGIAWSCREALCIPFLTLDGHYWPEEEEIELMFLLRSLLTHPLTEVFGQNFNYDSQYFAKYLGFLPNLTFDTMIAQHVLFPGIPKALDFLSSMYCHWHRYWKDEINDYNKLPENMEQYWTYNCLSGDTLVLDAYCHWRPLREISLGDDLLTFEEQAGPKGTRKLVHAVVTNKASSFKPSVRVIFTDGTWLEGTPDHRVIAQEKVPYRQQARTAPAWKTLGDLQPGEALPHVPAWVQSSQYEDGWMAGLVDGEGTLGHHSRGDYKSLLISIAQKEGLVADRLRRGLRRHNFTWNEQDKHGVIYFGVRGGLSEQLRFLGLFETDRLQCNMLNIAMEYGFGGSQQLPKKIVKEVVPIGQLEVFDITTTAGTFLTSSGIAHNCKDVVVTFECALVLKELLAHLNRTPQYDFMFRVSKAALRTMLKGIRVEQKARSETSLYLMQAIAEYDTLIQDIVGFPLSVTSPKQMAAFFYGDLHLPIQTDRKTKQPTLGTKAMAVLCQKEPLIRPLVSLIDMRRSAGVFLSTFCQMPLDTDGRMRCSFNVCGTETMRFSSSANAFGSGGNLQNLPKGEEE